MQQSFEWKCPSNIALVKYWGKHGRQLPSNPSLSMTLSAALTKTELEISLTTADRGPELEFLLDKQSKPAFEQRLQQYLNQLVKRYPVLEKMALKANSVNTFPHSSGIASSASGFGAFALNLLSAINTLEGKPLCTPEFFREASELARLGSGSASRSVYGGFTVWGETPGYPSYSDQYAAPLEVMNHPVFDQLGDAILLVSTGVKTVGSSAGHSLMNDHPFARQRFAQARQHVEALHDVLLKGDWDHFVEIVEKEALTLHGLMMSSSPGYVLMEAGTLAIIQRIRAARAQTGLNICFTLDAGPNVHVLYPFTEKEKVMSFINAELLPFCHEGRFLDDGMGNGPEYITAANEC